jgi:hypothetical protein
VKPSEVKMSSDKVSEALDRVKVRVELVDGVYQIMIRKGKEWHTVATEKKYKPMLAMLKTIRSTL